MNKPVSTATQTALNLKANIASPSFTGTATVAQSLLIGGDISLNGNMYSAKNLFENGLSLASTYAKLASPTFTGFVGGLTKVMVDLSNVDNTSDLNKPVSTATQTALNLKANIASPSFTGSATVAENLLIGGDVSLNSKLFVSGDVSLNGIVTAVTQSNSDNSNKVATTAFVKSQGSNYALLSGASFTGDISLNTRLYVGRDASFNGKMFVAGDLSVNGNITGNYPANSIPLNAVIGATGLSVDLSSNQTVSGVKTFVNDMSLNSRLFSTGNVSLTSNNLVSTVPQPAGLPTATTISNLSKLTNNANGTYVNIMEISKSNGLTIAYNTTNGSPIVSSNGGQTWNTMPITAGNTGYNAMLCLSPDGRIRIKQEVGSSTGNLYISTDWGNNYNLLSLTHTYLYSNLHYGYTNYNDQTYAFSHDGSVVYFIARDSNNTIVIWKNTDASFNSFTRQNLSWSYTLNNAPRAIATSGNGQYVLTITGINPTNGMYIFASSNYGASYTKTINSINSTWSSIAVSYSGRYQCATTATTMYQSSDFGSSWTPSNVPNAKWNSISMSNDGKNRVACIDSSYQYITFDYGSNWSVIPNSMGNWKKAVLVDMSNNENITIFSHDGVNIFKNTYICSEILQKTTINSDFNITTPYHYLNNMGKVMNTIKSNLFVGDSGRKLAISNDGKYMLLPIANKQTLFSQDYGSTWNGLTGLSSQTDYKYAAMSGNAQYMFVRKGSVTYWSSNYGLTWSLFTGVIATDNNNGIALSYTGQYIVYAGSDASNNSKVYLSSNYGSTWSSVASFPTASTSFSAAMSDNAQYISVLSSNSTLLVSSDYGATWSTKYSNALLSCSQVAISASGQYHTIISPSSIFTSNNYGMNFNSTFADVSGVGFTAITMIGSGEYQYAVNNTDNYLYRSMDYGSSWSAVIGTASAPSNSLICRDGTTMVYSVSGDIMISRVAETVGSINPVAFSVSKKGIVSALDLSVNGTITSKSLIVDYVYENGNLLGSKYATLNSPAFTGTVTGITKTMVDLSNVDNTSDLNKPVSNATQTALNAKANIAAPSFTGLTNIQTANISQNVFVTGDASLNSKLFVAGDVSINGMLYANFADNTVPTSAIIGGIPSANGVFSNDISANAKLFVGRDVSFNQKLFVKNDITANTRLFVNRDVSMNANLYVNGKTTLNNTLDIVGNVQLLSSLQVAGDVSMNGNLNVLNTIHENGVPLSSLFATTTAPNFVGTANFEKIAISELLTVNAITEMNGTLTVNGNVVSSNSINAVSFYENGNSLASKYATLASPTFTGIVSGITKSMVDLSNVDNTSDANKPISNATQTALNLKSDIASPTFTGVPLAPTAALGTNTTQIATTGFVYDAVYNITGVVPEPLNNLQKIVSAINSDASFSTTVSTQLNLKAPIASPTFTGSATIPTANISQKLLVAGDTSLNGNVFIGGILTYDNDFSINKNLSIGGDVSFTGNIIGNYPVNSIPSTAISGVKHQFGALTIEYQPAESVEFDDEFFELTRSSGFDGTIQTLYAHTTDLSFNGNLYINGQGLSVLYDLSVNHNLYINNSVYENGVLLSDRYAPKSSPTFTGIVSIANLNISQNLSVTGDISMNGNFYVANTIYENGNSLASKYATLASPTFTGTVGGITKSMVGLGNVDNTSDANKPVSSATQTALDLKADLASPTFTGTPLAPTATSGSSSTQIATTAFVRNEISNLVNSAPSALDTLQELANAINSDASFASTVTTQIGLKANTASPTFTGSVTIPTANVTQNLLVSGDASMNGNLYVTQKTVLNQDVSMNKNLDLSGSLIAHNNVNVYGIINQYTTTLDQGYIVNYANNENTIQTMQQQIATLQQQLASVLQILANNNIQ